MFWRVLFLSLVFCSTMFAYRCFESGYCSDTRLGLGAYHSNFYGAQDLLTKDNGGILSLYEGIYWKHLYLGFDGFLEVGKSNVRGIFPDGSNGSQDTLNIAVSIAGHLGIKFDSPLGKNFGTTFWYLAPILERRNFGFNDTFAFANASVYIGGGLMNRTFYGERFGIESNVNYAYSIGTRHALYRDYTKFVPFDGYRLELSLGMIWRSRDALLETSLSGRKKPDFYARIKGIYYAHKATTLSYNDQPIPYKANANLVLMIELGLSFDSTYGI